jgi:hypothetical protein
MRGVLGGLPCDLLDGLGDLADDHDFDYPSLDADCVANVEMRVCDGRDDVADPRLRSGIDFFRMRIRKNPVLPEGA